MWQPHQAEFLFLFIFFFATDCGFSGSFYTLDVIKYLKPKTNKLLWPKMGMQIRAAQVTAHDILLFTLHTLKKLLGLSKSKHKPTSIWSLECKFAYFKQFRNGVLVMWSCPFSLRFQSNVGLNVEYKDSNPRIFF